MSDRLEELKRLAAEQLSRTDKIFLLGLGGRLKSLAEQLRADEAVHYIALGGKAKTNGILLATDARLLYRGGFGGKAFQSEVADLPYEKIASVSFGGGFRWMGERQDLEITTTGESFTIESLHNRVVDDMVAFIRERGNAARS